jgi:glycerol uptake facilitator-like aquaporin
MKQALCAETLGTLILVMTVVGSGIMAQQLSGGIDGLALIGNTIATGAILVVLITIFGPISGAHFNPTVTLSFYFAKEISAPAALGYILGQVCGGLAGTVIAHLMFDLPLLQIATTDRASLPLYCSEFIATAGLLSVILVGRNYRPSSLPLLVGLYISAGYWFTSSTSFANPAVTLARMFTDSFSGIAPSAVPFFIFVQLIAAWPVFKFSSWLISTHKIDTPVRK